MEHGIVYSLVQRIRNVQGKYGEFTRHIRCRKKLQEVSTKSLLVEIKQGWQDEMHLVVGDYMIVEQDENMGF